MSEHAANHGKPWSRDDLILTFDLYCRIPFRKTRATTPAVQELASLLGRTPASIARKLGNFGALDPALRSKEISGLTHTSKQDETIWNEFNADWSRLVVVAHGLREAIARQKGMSLPLPEPPPGPSERLAPQKVRIHQDFFRRCVLSSYEMMCCITGIPLEKCLVASHIIPWRTDESKRADPTNGLCLSATFDRLFDSGSMTVSQDMKVRMSRSILEHTSSVVRDNIAVYHGQKIRIPTRFLPSLDCLRWHEDNVFAA